MSTAFVPSILDDFQNRNFNTAHGLIQVPAWRVIRDRGLAILTGTALLSVLAQISIPLGFTPVPITGQTFGVAMIAMLWGRKLGFASVAAYLALGASGLPVFAHGSSGLTVGPTLGYLIGMAMASIAMGTFADRGWTRTFKGAWVTSVVGSVVTFSFGLVVLSFFVPREALLISGLLPFLPGDAIKTVLAAAIASSVSKRGSHV